MRGAATNGCSRPRREYGATVVLFALFWLQSMRTLASRLDFFMSETTRSGWSASRLRASSLASALICADVCVPSSAAYRWMPFEPLVTGIGSRPIGMRMSRTRTAISATSGSATSGPGSRSSTIRSGLRGRPAESNRHCGTWTSSAAICASQASVARLFTSG